MKSYAGQGFDHVLIPFNYLSVFLHAGRSGHGVVCMWVYWFLVGSGTTFPEPLPKCCLIQSPQDYGDSCVWLVAGAAVIWCVVTVCLPCRWPPVLATGEGRGQAVRCGGCDGDIQLAPHCLLLQVGRLPYLACWAEAQCIGGAARCRTECPHHRRRLLYSVGWLVAPLHM